MCLYIDDYKIIIHMRCEPPGNVAEPSGAVAGLYYSSQVCAQTQVYLLFIPFLRVLVGQYYDATEEGLLKHAFRCTGIQKRQFTDIGLTENFLMCTLYTSFYTFRTLHFMICKECYLYN